MPFVYIIYSSKLNKYYVGACIDLERRFREHNIGHSKYTSTGIPWILKYTETFETLQEAKKKRDSYKEYEIEKIYRKPLG